MVAAKQHADTTEWNSGLIIGRGHAVVHDHRRVILNRLESTLLLLEHSHSGISFIDIIVVNAEKTKRVLHRLHRIVDGRILRRQAST